MDMDQILAAAAAHHVALEINAHRISDLDYLEWGVGVARKGWLRAEDVIASLDAAQMAAYFLTP